MRISKETAKLLFELDSSNELLEDFYFYYDDENYIRAFKNNRLGFETVDGFVALEEMENYVTNITMENDWLGVQLSADKRNYL